MSLRKILLTCACIIAAIFIHLLPSYGMAGKQKVIRQNDNIHVSYRYKTNTDMHIVIGKCGINNMLNIKAIYLVKNDSGEVSPWATKRSTLFMNSCTDWIGPYMIKSLVHNDGGSCAFTGGWHGGNGDGTGTATGKTDNISVKVNGVEIQKNKVYEGDVEITATNYIQAYNTKKLGIYVLKEVVNYKVTPFKISVGLESTALEDTLLQRYYGLQTQNYSWKGKIVYGNGISSAYGKYSDGGPVKDKIVDTYTLFSPDGYHKLIAWLDTSYGLGTFENLDRSLPTVFTETYKKTYFNLINGIYRKIEKGNSIGWKGSYRFK